MRTAGASVHLLRRALDRVTRIQAAVGELLIAGLAIFVSLDAILRWSINWSFLVTDEVGGYVMVIVAFFGMAVALHERSLFRVEVLFNALKPRAQRRAQFVFDIASLAFAAMIAWELAGLVLRSYGHGILAPTILRTPLWIPQAGMALGGLVVALVLLGQILDGIRDWRGARAEPRDGEFPGLAGEPNPERGG